MTPSKPGNEVATISEQALALGLSEEEYREILADEEDALAGEGIQTPILKICQPLTKQVVAEEAEPGQFLNTLTGEAVDGSTGIEFIVAHFQRGRFYSDKKTNKGYPAYGDTIPESWADAVGEQFVGTRFDEHPDAEEQFKAAVNNKEREWGSGPTIATTYVYTGLMVTENGAQPVRLSLMRTQTDAHRKITTLKKGLFRAQPYFTKVFRFKTEKKIFAKGPTWLLVPSIERDATPEEQKMALEVAQAARAGQVREAGEVDDGATVPKEAPKAEGALAL